MILLEPGSYCSRRQVIARCKGSFASGIWCTVGVVSEFVIQRRFGGQTGSGVGGRTCCDIGGSRTDLLRGEEAGD